MEMPATCVSFMHELCTNNQVYAFASFICSNSIYVLRVVIVQIEPSHKTKFQMENIK